MVESERQALENVGSLLKSRYEELNPNDPRFQNVELYRGTTLDRLVLTSSHNFTGSVIKSKSFAGAYLYNGMYRDTGRPLSDEQRRIARDFGIDEYPFTPVLITIHNSEKYLEFGELYLAITSEWEIDLGKIEPGDISFRQLLIQEMFLDYYGKIS